MPRLSGETALGLAWIIALISSLAVLFIGEVLGQTPCILCWFQRPYVPLGHRSWARPGGRFRVGAMALHWRRGGVAMYHIGLYVGLIPEAIQPCTATGPSCTDDNQLVFGIPIPLMALVAFTIIGVLSALSLKEKQT